MWGYYGCGPAFYDGSTSDGRSPGDGGLYVSYEQFEKAITCSGFPSPSRSKYEAFISQSQSSGAISSKRELAMFLANVIQETGGLQFTSELACKDTNCPNEYRSPGDAPNKFYYGRGYLQLSWSYNYRAASQALYGDHRLVDSPDQVATNEGVAWATAFWFWKQNVHSAPRVQLGNYGETIRKINGALECSGYNKQAENRFRFYACACSSLGVPGPAPRYEGTC